VREQLDLALGQPSGAVSKAAVWLLGPPPLPHVHPPVWQLVSLAAVAAMEYGRALLWAHRHGPSWPDPGPAGLALLACTPLPPDVLAHHIVPRVQAARAVVVQAVSRAAAARFWLLLQDFVDAHPVMPGWPVLPAAHPFLFGGPGGRLAVRIP
jgi:hypothetical protein